jgi:hypothetical protein
MLDPVVPQESLSLLLATRWVNSGGIVQLLIDVPLSKFYLVSEDESHPGCLQRIHGMQPNPLLCEYFVSSNIAVVEGLVTGVVTGASSLELGILRELRSQDRGYNIEKVYQQAHLLVPIFLEKGGLSLGDKITSIILYPTEQGGRISTPYYSGPYHGRGAA